MSKKEAKEAKAPKVENVKVSPFSNDTTFQVSAPFGAGGTGTTVYGTYGDNGEHSYYYYQDNGDLDQITLDKGSSRYTWLDDLVKDQVKNNAKYPSWFTLLFPGVASKQKFGGNMNYASYLEGGGAAPQNAAPQVSKEDIAEVITAALNGTGETKQKATKALQEMMQDASLAPLVEQVMSEMGIPSQKCGGRVKKKEMGSKLVKAEKAKCGCALKKVGGRLIEVDTCTGLPIHRNGGQVKKYQNAAGAIQRADDGSYYFKDGPASRTYTAAEAKERLGAVTPKEQASAAQPASITRTESDGMTNEALLTLDAGKALTTLSRPDFQRWMDLNSYQQGRNASLIHNGTRYANEEAYNKAVEEETLKTAPQFDLEAALNTRGKRKRNALYADFKTAMEKHVANNPLYQGPAALSQEQLSATSFKNDKKLNYSDYLK